MPIKAWGSNDRISRTFSAKNCGSYRLPIFRNIRALRFATANENAAKTRSLSNKLYNLFC